MVNKSYDVTILGGTGRLGQRLAENLNKQELRTLVTTRDADKYRQLFQNWEHVQLHQVDQYDSVNLFDICKDTHSVINLIHIQKEGRRSRIDFPPARRGDFEEVLIELPRRLVHAGQKAGNHIRVLHVSCVGASPLSSSARLRAQGLGEIIVRESSEDADKLGHLTYLNGPKFVHGSQLQTTVLRLPDLSAVNLTMCASAILEILDDSRTIGQILEVDISNSRRVVYPYVRSA
ncbi:NAD-dependent epimerase/dehydratase family protein [Acidithiobacillus sp. VAN18-1]|uniref:NAD-dependent epimerase/dehydratase family protein n=1 Tax=Igneacidithiobacillus copahuensis TaxID=2724909 RepID=A0AAE2YPC4_9PROT|nr:NAD-dependent epimerase/dehydratase family protein [Igneacidithiobacillus copahuensis]MBU2787530.1 NAD-dependent epimerase/dehydratase family protein [Igneacidithiobacillus copahuensis]MBU2797091.1 NAD-dependent epimerase/dehydratase family protein [Acidithiobacillus sp. VAN18-2]